MGFDLEKIRARFPSLSLTDNDIPRIYLDNPGGTQVPASVADAMSDYLLESNANIGGGFVTSNKTDQVMAEVHAAAADLLNAPSADEIVFGQNMTTLTLHMSRSIGRLFEAGDEIVLARMCHDGNISPWLLLARDLDLEVLWLPFNRETYEYDPDAIDNVLSDRTRLVCIGAASNMTGTINNVKAIAAKAREAGAMTYVDAVQSVPHVSTDVQDLGCDFLACSAYKFFGPHQGMLWGRREILEQLEPYKVRPAPATIPSCFETGTQSHEGMAGTAAAIDYLAWVGETMAGDWMGAHARFEGRRKYVHAAMDCLFDYEISIARHLIGGLQQLPGVRIHGITDTDAMHRRVPTVALTVEGINPEVIASELAARNIFVWHGDYYAVEVARTLGIFETGGAVRIGPVHYNSEAEIDAVLNALEDILPNAAPA